MANNRLNWQPVQAPSFHGVTDALRLSNSAFNSGTEALSKAVTGFEADQTKINDQAFYQQMLQYRTPEEAQAAIAAGQFGGADPSKVSSQALMNFNRNIDTLQGRQENTFEYGNNVEDRSRFVADRAVQDEASAIAHQASQITETGARNTFLKEQMARSPQLAKYLPGAAAPYATGLTAPVTKATSLLAESAIDPSSFGSPSGQGFDPNRLVELVAIQESGNRERDAKGNLITSTKGAQGKMQVMPTTNLDPGFGITPARDDSDAERTRVGKEYLGAMLNRYQNPATALAAYNAGPGVVDDYLNGTNKTGKNPNKVKNDGIPPFEETQKYVKNILGQLGGNNANVGMVTSATEATKLAEGWKSNVQMRTASDQSSIIDPTQWATAEKDTSETADVVGAIQKSGGVLGKANPDWVLEQINKIIDLVPEKDGVKIRPAQAALIFKKSFKTTADNPLNRGLSAVSSWWNGMPDSSGYGIDEKKLEAAIGFAANAGNLPALETQANRTKVLSMLDTTVAKMTEAENAEKTNTDPNKAALLRENRLTAIRDFNTVKQRLDSDTGKRDNRVEGLKKQPVPNAAETQLANKANPVLAPSVQAQQWQLRAQPGSRQGAPLDTTAPRQAVPAAKVEAARANLERAQAELARIMATGNKGAILMARSQVNHAQRDYENMVQ